MKLSAALLALSLGVASTGAQALTADFTPWNGTGATVWLEAGDYTAELLFGAWSPWASAPSDGREPWTNGFAISVDGTTTGYGSSGATPELALANVEAHSFTVSVAQDVKFWISDSNYRDNRLFFEGQIYTYYNQQGSMRVEILPADTGAVPLPAAALFGMTGLGAFAYVRRRKSRV